MDSMTSVFGRRVKSYRNRRGLTQDELARLANIDDKYVGNIERGEKAPSFEVAERLARALKVEYHELFLPDRIASARVENATKVVLDDLAKLKPESFRVFFDDLLAALRRLDRNIDADPLNKP